MAIVRRHVAIWKEVFALPGLLREPVLVFGYQDVVIHRLFLAPWSSLGLRLRWKKLRRLMRYRRDIRRGVAHPDTEIPEIFRVSSLNEMLGKLGVHDISVLDLFDARATLRYDMNQPVPEHEHGRYGTFMDVGCLEHVFDTRQCLENSLRMVRTGGVYFLHTNVNGYFGHGIHVFHPEALLAALRLNGFEVFYTRYSSVGGVALRAPTDSPNTIIWLAARKLVDFKEFQVPQQEKWLTEYRQPSGNGSVRSVASTPK